MPAPEPGTRFPLCQANVSRAGTDVSVIGYGAQIADALGVAEKLAEDGISVEVVDLRTIAPFDAPTILTSVAKTRRAVIVHEARTTFGPSAEIAAQIYGNCSASSPRLSLGGARSRRYRPAARSKPDSWSARHRSRPPSARPSANRRIPPSEGCMT
jgi:transketolase C-terminal domain/subunit